MRHVEDVIFLTMWGSFLTWLTHLIGIIHQCSDLVRDKYHICAVWKWYHYFYQVSLILSIVVCIIFWGFLWKYAKELPEFNTPIKKLVLILDHTVPVTCMIIDYILINTMPFLKRHYIIQLPLLLAYIGINVGY